MHHQSLFSLKTVSSFKPKFGTFKNETEFILKYCRKLQKDKICWSETISSFGSGNVFQYKTEIFFRLICLRFKKVKHCCHPLILALLILFDYTTWLLPYLVYIIFSLLLVDRFLILFEFWANVNWNGDTVYDTNFTFPYYYRAKEIAILPKSSFLVHMYYFHFLELSFKNEWQMCIYLLWRSVLCEKWSILKSHVVFKKAH